MPIKVFLITDFCLLSRAIELFIGDAPLRFELVGSAAYDKDAIDKLRETPADIILLDIDGLEGHVLPLLASLREHSHAKVLLLTRFTNHALQDKAVMRGARGVLDRHLTPETLLTALEKVNAGQVWLDREATGRIFIALSRAGSHPGKADITTDKSIQLTEREHEIVAFLAHNTGEPAKVIASKLHICESTLRNHLTSIYDKLGVANRPGLLAYAFQHGLTEPANK